MVFGAAFDVNLQRVSSPARLQTDQLFTCGSLGVANSAAATALGSVTDKVEVFDENGVSLGFFPVYDAIT